MLHFLSLPRPNSRIGGSPTRTGFGRLILGQSLLKLRRLLVEVLHQTEQEGCRGRTQGEFRPRLVVLGDHVPIQPCGKPLDFGNLGVPCVIPIAPLEDRCLLGHFTPDLLQDITILF